MYLLHFDQPYKHARHYLGWAADLQARLDCHRAGRGARLLAVLAARGDRLAARPHLARRRPQPRTAAQEHGRRRAALPSVRSHAANHQGRRMTRTLRAVDGDGTGGDPLPHNITAEQAVLGAAMLSPAALAEARGCSTAASSTAPPTRSSGRPSPPSPTGATRTTLCPSARISEPPGWPRPGGPLPAHPDRRRAERRQRCLLRAHRAGPRLRPRRARRQLATRPGRMLATGDAAADLRGKVAAEAAALAEADRRGWPDPVPLSAAPEVPTFPLWALPDWLGEYAACLAEVTQTPADLAGCLALAVLAVAAEGKSGYRRRPGLNRPACTSWSCCRPVTASPRCSAP